MALSHFWLQAKSSLPLHRIRISPAGSRFYSSMGSDTDNDKLPPFKKVVSAEEKSMMAIEPIIKECEVGVGLKGFACKLKDKLLRTLHPPNHNSCDVPIPVNPTVSPVFEYQVIPDCGSIECRDSEFVVPSEHALNSLEKDINSESEASGVLEDASIAETADQLILEIDKTRADFPSPESEDAFNTINISTDIASRSSEENYPGESMKSPDPEPTDEHTVSIESCEMGFDKHPMSNPDNLSSFQSQSLEKPRILDGMGSSSPGSAECENVEQAEMMMHNLFVDSGSKADVGPQLKKSKRLYDIFQQRKHGKSVPIGMDEVSKPKESLSAILFSLPEDEKSPSNSLSSSNGSMPSGETTDPTHDNWKKLLLNAWNTGQVENENSSIEGVKPLTQFDGAEKTFKLKESIMEPSYEIEKDEGSKPRSLTFAHQRFALSNECKKAADKTMDIKSLVDFIRQEDDAMSNTTNDFGHIIHSRENSLAANMERSDDNKNPMTDQTSASDHESIECSELEQDLDNSIDIKNGHKKWLETTMVAQKESEENKVLIKFLRHEATESDVSEVFSNFGKISKVEIHSAEYPCFKTACIYFQTRKGLEAALNQKEIVVRQGSVIVQSTDPTKKTSEKIQIPSSIGDSSIPTALVKNPTRTIKITKLTPEISFHHIEDALAFCESDVSGYYLGCSNSVAYVEFKTELGKENALAKHCINVMGRDLVMLRIDAPRTTVMRTTMSGMQSNLLAKNIISLCRSVGEVRSVHTRSLDILDVYFKLEEWPNMLNIINRLNGVEVEGIRLQAAPAPVFPPDILSALWQKPEERKHVKMAIQSLLHQLEIPNLFELHYLENEFFDHILTRKERL